MQAIVINRHGGPEVFEAAQVPTPLIQAGHVLIEVKATSVNPVDTKIREGSEGTAGLTYPAILHLDVAGVVKAVGEGVTRFQEGDEVYGCAGGVAGLPGALADYMLADADLIAHKPRSASFAQAAALPLVSITAWEALVDRARIRPADHVLIQGGTGGVGHLAIQLAKAVGATVSTTVSTDEKARLVRELGADHVALYPQETPQQYSARITEGAGFDTVFDTVGGVSLLNSLSAARLKGHVVSIIGYDTYDLSEMHFKGLKLDLVFMPIQIIHGIDRAHHGDILRRIAVLVDAGAITPLLDQCHPFTPEGVAAAHERLQSAKAIGKVVIAR